MMELIRDENAAPGARAGEMNEGERVWGDFCSRLKMRLLVKRQSSNDLLAALKTENAGHTLATDDGFAPAFRAEFDKQYGGAKSQKDES